LCLSKPTTTLKTFNEVSPRKHTYFRQQRTYPSTSCPAHNVNTTKSKQHFPAQFPGGQASYPCVEAVCYRLKILPNMI
jgi:hypothetical protein